MPAATLVVTFAIPDTTASADPDGEARRIAVEALQQVAYGVGDPGATVGSAAHILASNNSVQVASWAWTPPS
jgi:hypothetical protein